MVYFFMYSGISLFQCIYLFLKFVVMLGLCCCVWAFSGGGRALGRQVSGAGAHGLSGFGTSWA